jgi:hypothetical protein
MLSDNTNKPRIDQLKELLIILANEIDAGPGARDMASLCKQYRETLAEIEQIEGDGGNGDEIAEILGKRELAGKSGAVRKDRSKV